ncbi:MAG: tRNA 2-thiocytidine biosynthesis protein TtcA [Lachnospiraceae bacterium]|nr:tRNA 2-thiocytidine biosynthesis protein TtcA [Lachnospiraceae bacterium]
MLLRKKTKINLKERENICFCSFARKNGTILGRNKRETDTKMDAERSIVKKFRKEIWRPFTRAINEYELIRDGDKIAVCISGGKDSMLMAKLFQELARHGKKNFDVVFLVMNPGYNEANYRRILENAEKLEVPITIFTSQIFDTVVDIPNSPCYLCARMRRGYLYSKAKELGCNKIALGHHFDDVIETILMGMLYGGQIQTMMPKLHSIHFEGMELIRPLYLIREADIIRWCNYNDLHFIRCACRFTEAIEQSDNVGDVSKRAEIKELIRELSTRSPFIEKNIFRSVENVNLNTVVAYKHNGVRHSFLDDYDDFVFAPEDGGSAGISDSSVSDGDRKMDGSGSEE